MLGENIQKINRMWRKRCVDCICQRGLFCVLQRYLKLVCESARPGPFCLILTLYTSSGSSLTDLYGLFFRWNMCTSGDFTQLARKKIFLNQFSWQQCLNATLSHCEPLLLLRARCYLVVLPFFVSSPCLRLCHLWSHSPLWKHRTVSPVIKTGRCQTPGVWFAAMFRLSSLAELSAVVCSSLQSRWMPVSRRPTSATAKSLWSPFQFTNSKLCRKLVDTLATEVRLSSEVNG